MGAYTENLRKRLRNPLPPQAVEQIRQGMENREKAALKGVFDGNCNRTDCQVPILGANWWNSSTRRYYCGDCAQSINYWSKKDDGIIICTEVSDPNDRPAFPQRPLTEHQAKRILVDEVGA